MQSVIAFLLGSLLALPSAATVAPWSVSPRGSLIWDGEPYIPVGLRIDGSVPAIEKAAAAGFKDVLVELSPARGNWQAAIDALESKKLRYMITLSNMAPTSVGIAVEPEGFRVPGITKKTHIEFPLPGATNALMILASQRDGDYDKTRIATMRSGYFSEDVDPQVDLPHVLLVYPKVQELRFPDYWEEFDNYRDNLLETLKQQKFGPGLRGIVNPMGNLVQFPDSTTQFVPTSNLFRLELEAYLRGKYTSFTSAAKSWSLQAPDFDSLAELAKLTPMWSSTRGLSQLWNSDRDQLYRCESAKSAAWTDIRSVVVAASQRRYQRLVSSIQQIINVPVVQDFKGWNGPYGPNSNLDGVGTSIVGKVVSEWIDGSSPAVSTAARWARPGVVLATDISTGTKLTDQAREIITETGPMGVRGWYFRDLTAVPVVETRGLDGTGGNPLFFPIAATNPAVTRPLPGGRWMLPSPIAGERIDFGPSYAAYRTGESTTMWSQSGAQRVKLRLANPKAATFSTADGSDPIPKIIKGGIEVTLNDVPLTITCGNEIPVPEPVLLGIMSEIQKYMVDAERRYSNLSQEAYIFKDVVASLERNPGSGYLLFLAQRDRMSGIVSPYTWIEAEGSKEHTFSDLVREPGASGDGVIRLRSRVPSVMGSFEATYRFLPRNQGTHEVWIAARIPADERSLFTFKMGEVSLRITDPPVSIYGDRFGWYRLGEVNIGSAAEVQFSLEVTARTGADMMFDSIVLTQVPFRPSGVRRPL